jgi:hypothetical protein
MKKLKAPSRPGTRRALKVSGSVVVLAGAWFAGVAHGESHANAAVTAAAITESNAADHSFCSDVFGSTIAIATQFHSPRVTLDTASTYLVTGDDICAYRRTNQKNDELVMFVLASPPSDLVGKLGVHSQASVKVTDSMASGYVVVASTDASVPVSSSDASWLLAAGKRALG